MSGKPRAVNPGGSSLAASACVCAPYDVPHMPILPFEYGCFDSHSTVSKPSSVSTAAYFVNSPSERYRPRISWMTET